MNTFKQAIIKHKWFLIVSVIYALLVYFFLFYPVVCEWVFDDVVVCRSILFIMLEPIPVLYEFFDNIVVLTASIFLIYTLIYVIYAKKANQSMWNIVYILAIALIVLLLLPVVF